MRHRERTRPFGIDPHLIIVFELGARIDPDDFRRAGLNVVDSSTDRLLVAFTDDPELAAFHSRLDALTAGIPEGSKSEPYASFFDAIEDLRPLGPADRVTDDLTQVIRDSGPDDELRLDVECWHPGESGRAVEWLGEVRTAVEAIGGRFVDRMVNDAIGLVLARVYLPARHVFTLAELDVIARMDVLPTPILSVPQLFTSTPNEIPPIALPDEKAPIVGLVDSGVASAHELIAGTVAASDALGTGIDEDQDEHGHGTMVASILLYGDVAQALASGETLRPMCRIASARVLDQNNLFPVEELWERDLSEAIEWCVDQGAKIVNLSVGDSRSPFQPPRQMCAAAIVDDLARRHGLVIVASAGNSHPPDYLDLTDESALHAYPAALLRSDSACLIDPATALLALTVGGTTDAVAASGMSGTETLRRSPMGLPNWPSPITRTGPGPGGAVKPEVVHRSGTLGVEDGRLVSNDAELGVIGARASSGRLLNWSVGTSFAAPAVSRIAAAIRLRFPDFSAEMVRALVLLSTIRLPFANELEGTEGVRNEGERLLVGYGRPSVSRAIESTSHRAVLVATSEIPVNGVHIYEIPVPASFHQSGGQRGIDIALCYSPRTRIRRLDYLATRMEFHLVKGMALDEVVEVFVKLEGEDLDDQEFVDVEGQPDAVGQQQEGRPPTPSKLGSRVVKLEPSTTIRSRGANQLGRKVFSQRTSPDKDTPMYLVVRSVNRWADEGGVEPYALAAALWRDSDRPEIHAELEARLEAVIEVPVEIELEL